MSFLIGLLSFFGLSFLITWLSGGDWLPTLADKGAFAAGAMFIIAGNMHFTQREKMEAMIPPNWPYRRAMNYTSGVLEIVLGIFLFFPSLRFIAAVGLMLLLIFVFPANLHVARTNATTSNKSRLYFQPLYLFWLWFFCL